MKTLDSYDFKGKKVLLRTDYNVPIKNGEVLDSFRIKESMKTIKELFRKGAKQIIIITHLGRPNGRDPQLKLDPLVKPLIKLSGRSIEKHDDCLEVEHLIGSSSIVLLENLRFYDEEEKDDEIFASKLAKLADVFVNDAFGVSHRKHASVHAITKFLPSVAGRLVEKELNIFNEVLTLPKKPFVAIIGGSKLETKLSVIQNLINKVDNLLLGGAMIFTFFAAKNFSVGKSLVDKKSFAMATMLMNNEKLVLPKDVVIADSMESPSQIVNVLPSQIPSYMYGLDIGQKSVDEFKDILLSANTIIWNGPLGYYENPLFAKATVGLLKFLADSNKKVIIGGGDTAALVTQLGLKDKFYHVSTGGGASLKLLEGKGLVALEALK